MFKWLGALIANMGRGLADAFSPPRSDFIIRSDKEALAQDWKMVGQDMRQALKDFEKEHPVS